MFEYVVDNDLLNNLSQQAKINPRLRQHYNLHKSHAEPCQKILNAIEPLSYIRPHRHFTDPKSEFFLAIRGEFALILFDEEGAISRVHRFSSKMLADFLAAEIQNDVWHTVISLESDSVLLEVKSGPFDANQPKDFALWAPEENSGNSKDYASFLRSTCFKKMNSIV